MSWRRYLRRKRADADHAREFDAHLEIEIADNVARGMTPEAARYAACRKFGNPTQIREDVYRMNSIAVLETLAQDLRYAARMMRKSPGFAATAVVTLALGLGANTAIFTLVDAVLLKPLPYPEPERILMLWEKPPGGSRNAVASANFLDWRENSKTVALAASQGSTLTMTGAGEPLRVQARQVSPGYFEILGASPSTGRNFLPEEGVPGNDGVLLVSHRFWFQKLGGDPNVIGRTLMLDGAPYRVIGTLPANSWFDRHPADVWMPLALTQANSSRDFHSMQVYGRLRPGFTRAAAQAELDGIAARIAAASPATNKGWGVTIDLLIERVVNPQLRQTLHVLLAAVGAVLLIACVNLANLLLARSAVRQREVWVRLSLGAGRTRLVQQFLTESVMLSLAGAVAGCGVGYALLQGLKVWMPPNSLPTQADVRLDLGVLGYLIAVALAAGLLFGLAPAFVAWRHNVAEGLKEGVRGSTTGSGTRLRQTLIVAEVALAFVLVATAGALIHSFVRLTGVDLGVETTNVVTMQVPRAMQRDIDPVRETIVMDRLRDSVGALPGVIDAALTSGMPLEGWGFGMPFQIQGPSAARQSTGGGGFKIVSPSYFRNLGIKLLAGRTLRESDVASAAPVIVINDAAARQYFKDADPIGQHLLIQRIVTGKRALGANIPWEIVGVVANERTNGLENDTSPGGYVTFDQSPIVGVGLVVRAHGDPLRMRRAIQSAIWSVNRDQAITDFKLLEEIKSESAASSRFTMFLLAGFALLALALAAVGIYGVVAYSVSQRTREIGIRAALGATRADLLGLALRNSLLLTGLGLAAGAIGIHWTGSLVASLLFQTKPVELGTVLTVAAVLAAVAFAAAAIPARRAARIDPAQALRRE